MDTPRLALLMLALEPRLRGCVFVGPPGSGKSALMQGLADLLPGVHQVVLPLGCDQEALLGGLDLEATLQHGTRVIRAGVLGRADGGVLLVDACNLLTEGTANTLLGALEEGELRIERDGISRRVPARFRLVGSYDPAEGQPRAHLLDRMGLIVRMPEAASSEARLSIVDRHLNPTHRAWQDEIEMLRGVLELARASLDAVEITSAQQEELCATAIALGVQGHRADLFASLAARASAALALRDHVQREDVEIAVRLVLLPRATRHPEQNTPPTDSPPPPQERPEPNGADTSTPEIDSLEMAEEILEALDTELPAVLDAMPFSRSRRSRAGSRGSTAGTRGRHVASVPGSLKGQRIDVIATLRAAAPWQRIRTRRHGNLTLRTDDIRIKRYKSKAGALFIFAVDASGSMALNRMRQAKGAVHSLLAQAYVNRDKVALMSFRAQSAELLLPPTSSVELLRRAVDQIPTGGGTPLAATLLLTLEVAEQAKRKGYCNIVLVMLTDGRANVGLRTERAGVDDELQRIAATVAAQGLKTLLIDTQRSFVSHGAGQKLARWLGGEYLYMPSAGSAAIAQAARTAVATS
ncbi:MAG: magnesium chelatase ATPase subunit D [Sinobacteraceae bacterium]|nr:magnesium chelatase ATPase subunit D [Nevskiaceae bacterium]